MLFFRQSPIPIIPGVIEKFIRTDWEVAKGQVRCFLFKYFAEVMMAGLAQKLQNVSDTTV